ncbi:hypothetical protein [Flavobacterium frigoris]|uniref:Nicotinic acid mononucleotide adenyltransferase n=1 Tax=Flavobacterium frigoris TaxID=229204 RepID=A0A1H9F450_FLAFI|nr:hypothetical protein [Flavobacterium frigoris]SEQ32712.1 hypothetical protein SAMN05444355_10275 [Flavobacterium frigoris]
MKTFIVTLLFLSLTISSYSQEKVQTATKEGMMKIEELPAVVIKSAGEDFSIYLPDRNADPKVRKLQDNFIAYDLGKNFEGYDTYLVTMEIKGGSLAATYDEKGKLIRVVENYKDVKLPAPVIYSVYKAYPGWEIVNDKYLYSQEEGDILKKQYNLKIKNGNDSRKLTVHADGAILAER